MIKKQVFGTLQDGAQINIYSLKNDTGMEIKIINYGAAIVSLFAPDRNGKYGDVVLGYNDLEGYVNDTFYFGCITGRYANRIANGKFTILGKEYQLAVNDGKNHLHGGVAGFNKRIWNVDKTEVTNNGPAITLSYISKDGEENYPGTVKLTVVYILSNDNSLSVVYEGITDKPTILNPTQHSYFNLTADMNNTILDHELMIDANKFTQVDRSLITTGNLIDVAGTPMDFRKPKKIGEDINSYYDQLQYGGGYDHNWVTNNSNGSVRKISDLHEPQSGRLMEVFTDKPRLQFYSGNFLDGTVIGKGGIKYQKRTGLCLEAQYFPDSPNKPYFPSALLKPGEIYRQKTIYKFSVK